VSNIINNLSIKKKKVAEMRGKPQDKKREKFIDPYPRESDIGVIRSLNPTEPREIIRGVNINVKTVATTKEIPVCTIYYVEEIKQFAININGIVIRGDLCNIVPYQKEKSAACEYGIECRSFKLKKQCPYYHDPADYLHHKIPVPEQSRNFTIGSWIYTKNKNPSTYYTRHIGSKDRILYDLATLKTVQYRAEVSNREGQLIHDLLIYMILNAKNLVERYPQWHKGVGDP
jgi:hypothetical protein